MYCLFPRRRCSVTASQRLQNFSDRGLTCLKVLNRSAGRCGGKNSEAITELLDRIPALSHVVRDHLEALDRAPDASPQDLRVASFAVSVVLGLADHLLAELVVRAHLDLARLVEVCGENPGGPLD